MVKRESIRKQYASFVMPWLLLGSQLCNMVLVECFPSVRIANRPFQVRKTSSLRRWPSKDTKGILSIHKHHRAVTTSLSLSKPLTGLQNNDSFCITVVLLLSTFGISLERRTVIGKALSAPLVTMAAALFMANTGIIPFESSIYAFINRFLVPLAVPMLLYDSDLNRVINDSGSLLAAFGVGALATVLATLVAYPLLPMTSLGRDVGWKVACALAARHIGGAINFVAVSETIQIPGTAVSAAIAADNVVVALYFAILFALAGPADSDGQGASDTVEMLDETEMAIDDSQPTISLSTLAIAISISSALVTVGGLLTKWTLPKGTSALPLTSVLTVLAATIFPHFFSSIRQSGTALGVLFIQMFFAASGAAGSIRLVLRQAPSLFAFSALQIAVHFLFLIVIGRALKLDRKELYLSSNACVGGPTTAAAMAQAKNWKRLVLPALLIGILGYATATAIALALGPVLVRLPTLAMK